MLKKIAKSLYQNTPYTEGNAVKKFVEDSNELTKIKNLVRELQRNSVNANEDTATLESLNKMLNEIDNALTFGDLLKATERFDFKNTEDPSVKKLGSTGMKTLLFFTGYVSPKANIAYYAARFHEKVEQMDQQWVQRKTY